MVVQGTAIESWILLRIALRLAAIEAEQDAQSHVPIRPKTDAVPTSPVKHRNQIAPEVAYQVRPTDNRSAQRV